MYPIRLLTAIAVTGIVITTILPVRAQQIIADPKNVNDTLLPDFLKTVVYNPATESLNVDFRIAGSGMVQFDLVDMNTKQSKLSKTVAFTDIGNLSYTIDMSAFPKGSYVLDFRSRSRFSGKKLVVKN